MKIQVISLFPEMLPGVLNQSMLFKAQDKKLVEFEYVNLRDYGLGKRKTVDDTPYGGGDGMLLKPEPLVAAIEAAKAKSKNAKVILMTPRGRYINSLTPSVSASADQDYIFVCARYEGYDERVTNFVDEQISIGSFVVTGGELPAMIVIDSIVRLIPGVLGGETSAENESFQDDDTTLEAPQYTRPEVFRGQKVPKVLLSGNHADIAKWRETKK